jgi:hypothetical protein
VAGDPSDLATAFLSAAESQVRKQEAGSADPLVSQAFVLGWQMAELYRPGRSRSAAPADETDLPGLSRLSEPELTVLRANQLQAGLAKLTKPITACGLTVPDAQALLANLTDPNTNQDAEIRSFHVAILAALTAADFRLGKAYGLGRALADTTRSPADPGAELARYRVATVSGWIRDLSSAFPPHAAHPVAKSLTAWSCYVEPDSGGKRRDLDAQLRRQLGAQGRLWRNLLSGERLPTQTLEVLDYLKAAEGMFRQSGSVTLTFVKHYWWVILLALALVFGGIALVVSSSGWAATGAGAASLLASLGLTWKGIGTALGTAVARIEPPLWDSQLDQVIYERITPNEILAGQPKQTPSGDEPSLTVVEPETPSSL